MKIDKIYILIFSAVVLLACSMPYTKIYTLHLKESSEENLYIDNISRKSVINICVESPKHLKQPYIVKRYSDYSISISKYSKWEASPRDIISKKMKEELESLNIFKEVFINNINNPEDYSLDIVLKRFELLNLGKDNYGEILLNIDLISPDGKKLYHDRIYKRVKLKSDSFDELAEGLSTVLNDIITLIKNEVKKILNN